MLGVEAPADDPLDAWSLTELVGYSDQAGSIVFESDAEVTDPAVQGPMEELLGEIEDSVVDFSTASLDDPRLQL